MQLTRIVMPFLVLVAVAAACMGMLNSLNVFFVPALSPAMFNIASIVAVVALVPVARAAGYDPILAVAVGALAGGLGQILVQWPALRALGFRFRPGLDLRDPGLRRVLLLMGPGTIGLAATQVNVFVNTVVATGEGTGAVSYLGYAFRVMYLPIGLFGVSIATATTPAMSRLAATDDTARMRSTLASAVALMLTLNVPATFGLVVLAEPIVRVLFERGNFTAADTVGTAAAVQLYALGLVGYSVVKIVSPTFYAIGRSRTPVAVGVAAVLLNAVLSVATAPTFGYRGLALSASIAALVNAGVLVWLARGALGGLELTRVALTGVKTLTAGAMMAGAAWLTLAGGDGRSARLGRAAADRAPRRRDRREPHGAGGSGPGVAHPRIRGGARRGDPASAPGARAAGLTAPASQRAFTIDAQPVAAGRADATGTLTAGRRWRCRGAGAGAEIAERLGQRRFVDVAQVVPDVVGRLAVGGQAIEVVALAVGVDHRERHRREHLVAEREDVLADRLAVGAIADDDDRHERPQAVDHQLAGRRRRLRGDDDDAGQAAAPAPARRSAASRRAGGCDRCAGTRRRPARRWRCRR